MANFLISILSIILIIIIICIGARDHGVALDGLDEADVRRDIGESGRNRESDDPGGQRKNTESRQKAVQVGSRKISVSHPGRSPFADGRLLQPKWIL